MKRSKALNQQHELQGTCRMPRLLKNLGIGLYPVRPRSPPPPSSHLDSADDSQFSDCDGQIPEGWDQWDAA